MEGKLSPLWRSTELQLMNGKSEVFSLAFGRSSALQNADLIFGKDYLLGEKNVLRIIFSLVIDGEKIIRVENSSYPHFHGGLIIGNRPDAIGEINEEPLTFIYPFPFRDSSISEITFFEILDYDLVKEAYRVIKRKGIMRLIVRDKIHEGLDIGDILKFVIKFSISKVKWKDNFWVVECHKE
ncbi:MULTISPECIES: hypothetical protein [Acidianus]|nr:MULTISPECIES: hypothetical protein [Acidianus]NON63034.1 hypothetical protein [Acidianus sp. RZ1]